jgi:hypothetical protein
MCIYFNYISVYQEISMYEQFFLAFYQPVQILMSSIDLIIFFLNYLIKQNYESDCPTTALLKCPDGLFERSSTNQASCSISSPIIL